MPTRNELSRMNDLMGRDLGRNPYGEPTYKWEYSENNHRRKVVTDDYNRPVVRWVDKPVLDEAGNPTGRVISVQEPIVFQDRAWPWLKNQWVVVKWCFTDRDEWERAFGQLLEWPARGYYIPTNAELIEGDVPTMHITEEFIGMCKAERKHTFQDYIGQCEKEFDLNDKRIDAHIDDVISDACNAFGSAKPGSRMGGISLPTPEFVKNFDHSFQS